MVLEIKVMVMEIVMWLSSTYSKTPLVPVNIFDLASSHLTTHDSWLNLELLKLTKQGSEGNVREG